MNHPARFFSLLGCVAVLALLPLAVPALPVPAERVVRIAELEIDPAQVQQYTSALRVEIATSIRVEPGVLSLYAVALKGQPEKIRLLEIYGSPAAYEAHLASPHFQTYKRATAGMVKSLKLLETDPILLGSKAQ